MDGKELANALKVSSSQAREATAVLRRRAISNRRVMRVNGESASKVSSYPAQSLQGLVERASKMHSPVLRDRIKTSNSDPHAAYKITEAVAFGDFLGDAARLQAVDVGIRLVAKSEDAAVR